MKARGVDTARRVKGERQRRTRCTPSFFQNGSVLRLACARRIRDEIAFAEAALKKFDRQAVALACERGIIPRAFVAEKGVRAVHLEGLMMDAAFLEGAADLHPALEWNMRIQIGRAHV